MYNITQGSGGQGEEFGLDLIYDRFVRFFSGGVAQLKLPFILYSGCHTEGFIYLYTLSLLVFTTTLWSKYSYPYFTARKPSLKLYCLQIWVQITLNNGSITGRPVWRPLWVYPCLWLCQLSKLTELAILFYKTLSLPRNQGLFLNGLLSYPDKLSQIYRKNLKTIAIVLV